MALNFNPATITEAVKKLDGMNLVKYEKSYGILLTSKGIKESLAIIRRHRIWETYLVQKLGFGWDEVHEIAEELEHISSEKLIDRLAEYLDHPKFDPHGEVIPDKYGKTESINSIKLSEADEASFYKLSGVTDQSGVFLNLLNRMEFKLGSKIEVLEKEEFDSSILVRSNKKLHRLSFKISSHIQVVEFSSLRS